jgi:hypothetical protein
VPIIDSLEQAGLLLCAENESLFPGRELSRIRLNDILDVVREEGETGSYRDPTWSDDIDLLGADLDSAIAGVVGSKTLAELLDEIDKT